MKIIVSNILIMLLMIGCTSSEEKTEEEVASYAQPKENEETVYTGEYIKIVDEEVEKQPKQPRLINAKAPLYLGRIDFTLGDTSITYTTFQKGYTDMHFSEKGVKMRIHDMYDAAFEIQLFTSDVFNKTIQTYYPEHKNKKPLARIEYANQFDGNLKTYQWDSGNLDVTQFSTVQGKIRFTVTGEMKNIENPTNRLPINLKVDMRFEHVHSSVRPKQ